MSITEHKAQQSNGRLSLLELVPAVLSIVVGIFVGKIVFYKSGYLVLGIIAGVVTVPVGFFVLVYGLAIVIFLPIICCIKLFGGTSARDEYFDDP